MSKTKLPMLYKRTELGQIQTWQICVDGDKFWTAEGIKDGTITENKPTVCKGKNIGRANETSPEDQALKEAQAKHKKKSESGYFTDINDIDNTMAYFEPMLCHSYSDYKDRVDFKCTVFVQPKLDGQRCIARKDGLWSRNGKPIVSVPHIMDALSPLFKQNPNLILDGELFTDKLKNDFNQIMHLCRQAKPTKEDLAESKSMIQYWIYDLPSCKDTFSKRSAELMNLLAGLPPQLLVFVETHKVTSQADMDHLYEKWLDEGMEGQIIRLDTTYEQKRSRNILKRKKFITDEYTIVDICEGIGNRSGAAGYMVLKLKDGRTFKSNIKTNFSKLTNLLTNRKKYIGKSATCKYFNLTPDGIPRFPYVIDIDRDAFE